MFVASPCFPLLNLAQKTSKKKKCAAYLQPLSLSDTSCNRSPAGCCTLSPDRLWPLFISPWSGQMRDCCPGYFRPMARFTSGVFITHCFTTSPTLKLRNPHCHNQSNHRSLKAPKPWLNLDHWNARVWAGIYSIQPLNYIFLICSSQNDNCSPWHNSTMFDPLLHNTLIAFFPLKGPRD